ncbi:Methyltransferase type 11 [Croceitalea dokdonensis DOKDO 023]|uniref:carnosine N-methyltransferase n=1 Tax=Croceitalea dokdonensis DOKDO 023 TaxID=1300341 RepID=A0A0P7AYV2_9FLAO|nr:methyltransferase domain-containing protein [Croceitalea dokdonensis]KPM33418.1 Methyltransferase type 11 [Croceitalea dokdonensis DOKDO 023]
MFTKKPIIHNEVQILIDESELESYYAESYFLYKSHLKYLIRKLNTFKLGLAQGKREKYFQLLTDSYIRNIHNVNNIVSVLEPKVTLEAYENLQINTTDNTQTTLKDFIYLRRDWCFKSEPEQQLKTTIDSLKIELSKIEFETGNALFIGCGVGRIAFEFTDIYSKVYATDKSFSMIWHLQKLLNGKTIDFYSPHEKNVKTLQNVAPRYSAKIPKDKLNNILDKFEVFVSDVLDLPFKDNSLNSVFSIYFTDVIALKLWFNQINQKLKNKGLFVHFGPLDYFFSNEQEMYTAEEFKQFFENNGYKTLIDKTIETTHLEDSNSISYKVYRNWFFVAQKNISSNSTTFEIFDETILKLRTPVSYKREGILDDGEKELEATLNLPNGTFTGADAVIQILKLLDGKTPYIEVLSKLQSNGFDVNDTKGIHDLLLDLLKQNVLKIC